MIKIEIADNGRRWCVTAPAAAVLRETASAAYLLTARNTYTLHTVTITTDNGSTTYHDVSYCELVRLLAEVCCFACSLSEDETEDK